MPDTYEPMMIYASPLLPGYWIVQTGEGTWAVPKVDGGWERRTRVYVPVRKLERVESQQADLVRKQLAA